MTVTIEPSPARPGDLRIHLTGDLDYYSGPALAQALTGLRPPVRGLDEHPPGVVLDLQALSFLDSSGLRALDASRRQLLDAGWHVTATPAQPQVQLLLQFADRSGWLVDGPLMTEESARAELPRTESEAP